MGDYRMATNQLGGKANRRIVVIGVLLVLAVAVLVDRTRDLDPSRHGRSAVTQELLEAYENQASDLQVRGSGVVEKILADDTKGTRHQRFILAMESGQTLLVAHNIDLAPRIADLKVGDRVAFFGEYEWNRKGGVIHWTHHDPGAPGRARCPC